MRFIILPLLMLLVKPVFSQTPSKAEIMQQMAGPMKEITDRIAELDKQIADAKKRKEDLETIKQLQEERNMLNSQLGVMQSVNNGISRMSAKTVRMAGEENNNNTPKKDDARIKSVSSKILSDAELNVHVKTILSEVEKIIPAAEKTESARMYNAAKSEWKSPNALNSSASSCWMYGHQAKAIWITGKACIDFPGNPDLLDNYAAFLTMTGAEQAAIPILLYLNNKFPNNSTVLNNLGQAWFGLGDLVTAKKYLEEVTELYPSHSMANLTLSRIYVSGPGPDKPKAMAALKASLKESFCTDKENLIKALGGEVLLDDLPDFDYPIEANPYHFESLLSIIPDNQSSLDDFADAESKWQGYVNAMNEEIEASKAEEVKLDIEKKEFIQRMATNIPYQKGILFTYHNSPSHLLAKRYLIALAVEDAHSQTTPPFKLNNNDLSLALLAAYFPGVKKEKPMSMPRYVKTLSDLCETELIKPLEQLEKNRQTAASKKDLTCDELDAINAKFISDAKSIQAKYKQKFHDKYMELKKPFDAFVSIVGYAGMTPTVADRDMDDIVIDFFANKVNPSYLKEIGKPPFEHRPMLTGFLNSFLQLTEHRVSQQSCKSDSKKIMPTHVTIPNLKQPETQNKYTVNLLGINISFEWGRMIFDESNLQKSNEGETKGSGVSSKQQSNQHISLEEVLGHGPSNFQKADPELFYGPLVTGIPDGDDTTHCYVEFDKYGNFSDFKLPMNADGTNYLNAFSNEKFDQRRWSWIACPSGREKILNGLFKKQ